jgi:hypothetical protein
MEYKSVKTKPNIERWITSSLASNTAVPNAYAIQSQMKCMGAYAW